MKLKYVLLILILVISTGLYCSDDIISVYEGSNVEFDDKVGYEEHHILVDETTVKVIEGRIRRQFCFAPEGRSPYEIIKNYEKAIKSKGGTIINLTRKADDYKVNNRFMRDYFTKDRVERMTSYAYLQLPSYAKEYLVGKISNYYIVVAAARVENDVVFTLVTVETEELETDKVSITSLGDGIAADGKVVVYDIFFDSGKSDVKDESDTALKTISDYMNKNPEKKFIVVGHTDNTGDFDMNIKLSLDRAKAVVKKLVTKYGVDLKQIKPYGVGPVSPVTSNSSDDGKAKNRRVEIVEQ